MAKFEIQGTLAKEACEKIMGGSLSAQRWYIWRKQLNITGKKKLSEMEFRSILAIALIRKDNKYTRFSNVSVFGELHKKYLKCPKINAVVEQYNQTEVSGRYALDALIKSSGYDRTTLYRLLPGFTTKQKYSVEKLQEMISAVGEKS